MSNLPQEPEAFAQHVAQLLHEIKPECDIELTGPKELLVNGRRLDLENVYRMVTTEPSRGSEIVRHYLSQLFATETDSMGSMTLDFARPRIMPRIQPISIFDHLDQQMVAHVPFVNDTVVVFVTDMPQMTISITTEQLLKWDLDICEVEEIALENLNNYSPELEIQFVESNEGGIAAIISEQDGYDAARLLLDGLYRKLSPHLGGNFYVAIPSRDMFVAVSETPPEFLQRVATRSAQDHMRLPYPISDEFFYVTLDGVAGRVRDMAA